jgi:voltage-gated potassium channel
LVLLVVELIWGLGPFLEAMVTVIWIIFIIDFLIRFLLAPAKMKYLKKNWLTAISLVVPALRVFRIVRVVRVLRVARAARSLRLFRIVSSLNRGMNALRASMGRRGFGYVLALTVVVILVGAAGMQAFEGPAGFESYGEALWWTAMLLTTIGSEFWPVTAEGRVLAFLLSVYGLAVFGYLTATLATYFIGREAESDEAEIAGTRSVEALRAEIAALRAELEHRSPPEARARPMHTDE